jgi:hypothetical protein
MWINEEQLFYYLHNGGSPARKSATFFMGIPFGNGKLTFYYLTAAHGIYDLQSLPAAVYKRHCYRSIPAGNLIAGTIFERFLL